MQEAMEQSTKPNHRKQPHNRLLWNLTVLCILNFFAFCAVALVLGGDAINGHTEDGRYFLALHGELTEVSKSVWVYSYVHALTAIASIPLAGFCGALACAAPRKCSDCESSKAEASDTPLARDGREMVTPMAESVRIRPSYWRLCVVSVLELIPFALALLVIGFPVGELLSQPLSVIGLLVILSFWVFGASAMGLLMFSVTITEDGMGQVLPPRFHRWDEMRILRRMFPFPFYVASGGLFSRTRVCIPRPWLVTERAEFTSAIRQYAPEDHPIRRRLAPEENEQA